MRNAYILPVVFLALTVIYLASPVDSSAIPNEMRFTFVGDVTLIKHNSNTSADCPTPREVKGDKVIACEKSRMVLQCTEANKTIKIVSASYGRTQPLQVICNYNSQSASNCAAEDSKEICEHTCDGRRTCELLASNSVFGDPCRNVYKYLEVQFNCV